MSNWNIVELNERYRTASPSEIIAWVRENAKKPVLTVNFRPKSAVLIHAVATEIPKIDVLWVDSGYNTRKTYEHARRLIDHFQLQVHIYAPLNTAAFRDVYLGIPSADTPEFQQFQEEVKLEPFRRGMLELQPDIWFAHLLKGQTETRDQIDIFSVDRSGRLKVSPFYYYTEEEIDNYLLAHDLESEERYYDPAKPALNKECGIHA